MSWFLALAATTVASVVATGLLAALLSLGLAAPVPAGLAVLVGQGAFFSAARFGIGRWVRAALDRPVSMAATEPAWLSSAAWLAEAAPRWLLGPASLVGLAVAATWPLLFRGLLPAVVWSLGLLTVATFVAAALVPDRAWHLAQAGSQTGHVTDVTP